MFDKYIYIFGIVVGIITFPVFIFIIYSFYILFALQNSVWFAYGETNPYLPIYLIVSFILGVILPIICLKKLRNHRKDTEE